MDSATWCRTPAAASAASRLRPEVSKNSSTALSSNEGELARSITTCAPAMASLSPSPVMVLTPLLGEAATTSWPRWRRMATVFEPIRPVPPMTTIFMVSLPCRRLETLKCEYTSEKKSGPQRACIMQTIPAEHAARRAARDGAHDEPKQTRMSRDLFPREDLLHCGISIRPLSALGQERTSPLSKQCPLCPRERTKSRPLGESCAKSGPSHCSKIFLCSHGLQTQDLRNPRVEVPLRPLSCMRWPPPPDRARARCAGASRR